MPARKRLSEAAPKHISAASDGVLFQGVIDLLRDGDFLRLDMSWKLLKLPRRHWGNLTTQQRDQLRPVLTSCFDRFKDWMGAFPVANILSERYANEDAFNDLDVLSERARLPHRALAAYGLGKIARAIGRDAAYMRAVERLRALNSDEAEVVRTESEKALRKLAEAQLYEIQGRRVDGPVRSRRLPCLRPYCRRINRA